MPTVVRSFLALFLAVSLFGASVNDASAGLAAKFAAAAGSCCDGDCPDVPACAAACAKMTRGGMPAFAPLLAQTLALAAQKTAATLVMSDWHPRSGLAPDGVRRPPRV